MDLALLNFLEADFFFFECAVSTTESFDGAAAVFFVEEDDDGLLKLYGAEEELNERLRARSLSFTYSTNDGIRVDENVFGMMVDWEELQRETKQSNTEIRRPSKTRLSAGDSYCAREPLCRNLNCFLFRTRKKK